jgi:hypothetical protein
MRRLLLGLLALAPVSAAASIRDVDFKNFTYPFPRKEFVGVPNQPRWMSVAGSGLVSLKVGAYTFPCDDPPCELVTFDTVVFGRIARMQSETALVTLVFHTGGTANWEFLYVIALRAGRPRVLAWMEAGSRADMGLRQASIDRGDLVLAFNDPDKRIGDCCSTGSITHRYRWMNGSFHRFGQPILTDDSEK